MSDPIIWQQPNVVNAERFTCGNCGSIVASAQGWYGTHARSAELAHLRICPMCTRPTLFERDGRQVPSALFGRAVLGISDAGVAALYEEARRCCGQAAWTAAVLCCRKLLMHVAVVKGAPEGGSFVSYVEYLTTHHFVPPDARDWVDHIRTAGNEANHEIVLASQEHAEELVSFAEMLLKVIFEFPAAVIARKAKPGAT